METNELLELLLAAHLRARAAELRGAAARTAHSDEAGQAAFRAQHPILEYVPQALAELRSIRTILIQ